MKRKITFLILSLLWSIPFLYAEIYLVGEASPSGWDAGNPKVILTSDNGSIFKWSGNLKTGDFKFLTNKNEWFPCYVAHTENQEIISGELLPILYRQNDDIPDYKFFIQAGTYDIKLDIQEKTLMITKKPDSYYLSLLGSASQSGWNSDNPLVRLVSTDNKIFRWKGDLLDGDFKLLTDNAVNWLPCLNASTEDEEIIYGHKHTLVYRNDESIPDYKFKVKAGTYTIVVDLEAKILQLDLATGNVFQPNSSQTKIFSYGGTIFIEGFNEMKEIMLYAADGKLVYRELSGKNQFNLFGQLKSGNYLVVIRSGNGNKVVSQKLSL